MSELHSIDELIDDLRQGKMIILMDDEDRENEGDLIMLAEKVRPEDINFMATHARGLICLTLTEQRCRQLDLPLMVDHNRAAHSTNFTVSIEAATGVTTGISAADRARTVLAAVARHAEPSDIVQPGHIFPLMAQPGGVLSRAGHTEAGCDLAKLAGSEPAAVIVEIMNDDGTMARRPDLEKFAEKHQLKIGTIADLIHYRSTKEKTVECIKQREVETPYGAFTLHSYQDLACGDTHFAMVKGDVSTEEETIVRVHVLDTLRDVLCIQSPDHANSRWSFGEALQAVSDHGHGVVVLICYNDNGAEMEARIDRLLNGQGYLSQDKSYRQVGTGAQILKDLGVKRMRLLSAPFKFSALSGFDLEVADVISHP